MPIELVYETHSTTEDNERGIATGWCPGKLSAAGREQARQMGRRRSNDGSEAIFTSDLARAIETVRIAFPEAGVPVFMDWRLRECDYGEMTGIDPDMLERAEHIDLPYPAGESWRQAVERVGWFIRDLRARWHWSRLLVVGHVATWWGLEHSVNGTRLEQLVATPFEWQEGWEYRL
ncbi:MAG TPA: histidine phosphatase family protein [Actinomycetota bacterium]|nr:histidine phosphatase family protein [Actinomycetota bacterium]